MEKEALIGGTWNVRGLGGPYVRLDPYLKMRCILTLCETRGWSFCTLSDLKFRENGVREYATKKQKWLLIVQGRVGILLNERMSRRWREAGAKIVCAGRADVCTTRVMGVKFERSGWREGLLIVATYAPTSDPREEKVRERERYREDLSRILRKTDAGDFVIVGGDMNAEVGAGLDRDNRDVLGAFGDNRRTQTGGELIDLCRQEELMVAGSIFQQKERSTWRHIRYGSKHELDHILVRRRDRWKLLGCKTVHFQFRKKGPEEIRKQRREMRRARRTGSNNRIVDVVWDDGVVAWQPYTDHDPVEVRVEWKKWWAPPVRAAGQVGGARKKPAYGRLRGSTQEAKDLRKELEESMEKAVEVWELAMGQEEMEWEEICEVSYKVALEKLGEQGKPHPRPWLKGKEVELDAMDADIAVAQEADREARTATTGGEEERKREANEKRKALNKAKKMKRRKLKDWENTWFVDLGDRATQAAKVNDQGELYRVLKELKVRGQMEMGGEVMGAGQER